VSQSEDLTFVHVFGRGIACTIRIKDQAPTQGEMHQMNYQWIGRPKKKHLPIYRQWVLEVNRTISDRWGSRIGYALGVAPNRTEFWTFEPGQAPQLVQIIPAGIP
jgi:hypothetical protein